MKNIKCPTREELSDFMIQDFKKFVENNLGHICPKHVEMLTSLLKEDTSINFDELFEKLKSKKTEIDAQLNQNVPPLSH